MRFVPDDKFDAALRPVLMADPVNAMYVEIAAPDIRFAALAVLLVLTWMGRRRWALWGRTQGLVLLGTGLGFYAWTLVSGNGRYFIWGLLLVGPLVVMAARELRASPAMRNTVILGVLGLQGFAAATTFVPNVWSLRTWTQGPGFALEDSPLREQPAVFLTLGSISYSALVPQMHPQSRWSNIAGQVDLLPGVREYAALWQMLQSPLPKFVVARATALTIGPDQQPLPAVMTSLRGLLARHALALASPSCHFLRSMQATAARRTDPSSAVDEGFWLCPVGLTGKEPESPKEQPAPPEAEAVFQALQQRCPQLFPPWNGRTRFIEGAVQRSFGYSDITLYVTDSGEVLFKHVRALNPSRLGNAGDVTQGRFALDCKRIPGRYLPPWARN